LHINLYLELNNPSKIINTDDFVTRFKQLFAKMGAEETNATSD
jgi:hypothetical protein